MQEVHSSSIGRSDNTVIDKKADKAIVGIATNKITIVARVDASKIENSGHALGAVGDLHTHYSNPGY
ncbi:hypothetical protein [Kitasatospora sp. MBT63]|uniref:hypothetical protein n=1 Tax=Kitasatospora sp. MBT63 TaxID=1444768 RepID=UPI00053B259A|nr:hypothetical protein [Kitasatospora sp. MBT63]